MEPSQCVPKLWSMISILKHNTHAIHVRIMLKFQCLNIYNYRSNLWKNIGTTFCPSARAHITIFLFSLQLATTRKGGESGAISGRNLEAFFFFSSSFSSPPFMFHSPSPSLQFLLRFGSAALVAKGVVSIETGRNINQKNSHCSKN